MPNNSEKNKIKKDFAPGAAPASRDAHKPAPPLVPEVPRDRKMEKALAGMAGLSLTQFRRVCRGIDLQCLACGTIFDSPRRKFCDETCRKAFMERLRKMGLA